jgi:hypothetical protein
MKINPFIPLALILFTSGCYTTWNSIPLKIQVLQPAIFAPPPDNLNAATFYNNGNTKNDSLNSGFVLNTKILFDTMNTDSMASVAYYESMINSLRIENYYDTVIDLGKHYPDIGRDSIVVLTDLECDSLINKYNCHIIYSLYHFEVNDISYTNRNFNETGLIVFIKAFWEISRFDSVMNRTLISHSDTVTFSNPYYSTKPQEKLLNDRPGLIKEAATDFGAKFASFLAPHWLDVERMYYKSGNQQMKLADQYIKNNEWLKAAEIWKQLSSNKNKNLAAKSMFNIALACEMEGSYDAAIDWVVKSYYIFGDKNPEHEFYCKDYVRILTKRKLEKKRLEKQLVKPVL